MVPVDPYRLSSIIQAHDYDVKGLAFCTDGKGTEDLMASCSRDGQVKLWGLKPESNEAGLLHSHHQHLHFVNAITILSPTPQHPAGMVASGGADNQVRLMDVGSLEMAACLAGHANNVCALAAVGKRLISGSWDSSAIVWDVETGRPLYSLLASADKTIKVWKQDKCIKTLSGHTDCVRALALLDPVHGTFASAANDNSIRIWNTGGMLIASIENAHDAYIYSLALLENGMLASAGEDRCIKIWDWPMKKCIQSIPVPATSIWTLLALEDGDVACGVSDGHIYIYSADPGRQIFDEALMEVYEEKLRTATIPSGTMESIDSSQVNGIERLDRPGSHAGQHIIVQSGTKVEAYQWDGQQWIKIGDVVDSKGGSVRQEFEGQLYDYVFDVQVEDGATSLKLPFNLSDNPYAAAQAFCVKNGLPVEYVDQVVDFILKNTEAKREQQSTGLYNPYASSAPTASAPKPAGPAFLTSPVRLSNANLDGILKKISEFNALRSTPLNLSPIEGLVRLLKKETSAKPAGLSAVFAVLSHWSPDQLFPVLDLVRIALLDERLGLELLDFIQTICLNPIPLVPENAKISAVNVTMQLRVLANAFQSASLWSALGPHRGALLRTVRALSAEPQTKDVSLPYQVIFNFCLMLGKEQTADLELSKPLLGVLLERLNGISTMAESGESLKLVLSAINAARAHLPQNQFKMIFSVLDELKQTATTNKPLIDLLYNSL